MPTNVFTDDEADQLVFANNAEGGTETASTTQAMGQSLSGSAAGNEAIAYLKLLAAWIKTKR